MVASSLSFDYNYAPVNDLRVKTRVNTRTGKTEVASVLVNDEPMQPTERFWTSLFARFGFNSAFFKYFDYAETFSRIAEREKGTIRMCIERGNAEGPRLLAVSNPAKPVISHDEATDIIARYGGDKVTYANGIIESMHRPRVSNTFSILGDVHENRFIMQTPIDGYGNPNLYLSLLRQVCENGAIGMARAFRSSLALGKNEDNVGPSIIRALDGFNNDEGYAALRQRFTAAGTSWMSVYESQQLYKMLVRLHHHGYLRGDAQKPKAGRIKWEEGVASPLITAFHRLTGDVTATYGLANLDALSPKRQRTLPVKCTMYEGLNFATEVATHYTSPEGSRRLNAWVGTTISSEYDMEGTKDRFGDFSDFLVDAKSEPVQA